MKALRILKIELAALICLGLGNLGAIEKPSAPPQSPPAAPTPAPPPPTPETAPPISAIPPPTRNDRGTAYKTFRENFDARRFAEALPAALEVVTLSEQKFGPNDPQLITPLTNLGTTQLRLKDYAAAEKSFQRALKIVDSQEGGFSRDVLRPLFGLGLAYSAFGQPAAAAEVLRRAVDASRRLDGLFNLQQAELLDPLIESYVAVNDLAGAEREQQYVIRVSELAYGKDDPRMLPVLDRGARRYEDMDRYASARGLQIRAIDIVRKAGGINDLRAVEPLRGIARAFRLEYVHGSESTSETVSARMEPPSFMDNQNVEPGQPVLQGAGRDALERALKILKISPDSNRGLRGNTWVDLGDWYQVAGDKKSALQVYKEAWKELSAADPPQTAVLEAPVQLAYRGPKGSFKRPPLEIDDYDTRFVELEFTVTPEGLVNDVKTVSKDAPDAQEKSVTNAIKRARYRPRIVNGAPVATHNVRYRQTLYIKK